MMSPDPIHVLQLALGFVFLGSAGGKLLHAREFFEGLGEYPLIPVGLRGSLGGALIVSEGLIAIAHLTGGLLAPVLLFELTLLAVFLGVTLVVLHRRTRARCLCFGRPGETVGPRSVARLVTMMLGAGALLLTTRTGEWPVVATWETAERFQAVIMAGLALVAASWAFSGPELWQIAIRCKRCGRQANQAAVPR